MTAHPEWIVCFGTRWNSASVYTEKHLISRFYRDGYKIFWVDPVPLRNLTSGRTGTKKKLKRRLLQRIIYQLKVFSKEKRHFYVFRPIFHPNVEGKERLNSWLFNMQLKILFLLLRIRKFVVFSSHIADIPRIFPRKKYLTYFQISGDFYSDLRGISPALKAKISSREFRIFTTADHIWAASRIICDKIQSKVAVPEKVHYFPHGVEYNHFDKAIPNIQIKKIQNEGRPIAGYFGALSHTVNQDVILALAENGFSVVLIGPILSDYSAVTEHPHVYLIGSVNYEVLPSWAAGFDVCFMAWHWAEWINNCNPSKTYEYLALGKPIISIRIPELEKSFPDLVYFADNPQEFVEQSQLAISRDNESLIIKRKRAAESMDWEEKYKYITQVMTDEISQISNY